MDVVDFIRAQFSGPLRIINDTIMESSLTWSHDGSRNAYDSGITGIRIKNAEGSSSSALDTSLVGGYQPFRAPQGDRIAFTSSQGIYSISVDGTNLQQFTSVHGFVPERSPDCVRIGYEGSIIGNVENCIIDTKQLCAVTELPESN